MRAKLGGSVMAAGVLEVDSAGERRNRTCGWMEKVEGEVTRLGARGNRAERRGTAGAVAGGGSARCSSQLDREDEEEEVGKPELATGTS